MPISPTRWRKLATRQTQAEAIKEEVTFYENLRNEVKLHSGDAIDLKQYEPAMRHLIDTYIRAEESKKSPLSTTCRLSNSSSSAAPMR